MCALCHAASEQKYPEEHNCLSGTTLCPAYFRKYYQNIPCTSRQLMYWRAQISTAMNQLSCFFLASLFFKIRTGWSQISPPPHPPFTHEMGKDKQIFLFFQLSVVFSTWNILVIKWCKADKTKSRKCSFFAPAKKKKNCCSCQKLVYYSRNSNSRCLVSNFSPLVI